MGPAAPKRGSAKAGACPALPLASHRPSGSLRLRAPVRIVTAGHGDRGCRAGAHALFGEDAL